MAGQIAVVGSGYWGKNLIRNFHSLGRLKTVCDKNEDILSAFEKEYEGVHGLQSLNQVLLDKDIKGVVIATPAELHFQMVRESLLAGKSVLVEKPLCLSENEGRELIGLAEEKGLVLMVGHLLWYHPAILKLKELINAGELGRIQYIYSNRLNLGKIRREENILWSFAPHDISTILGLLGEMPSQVQAQGGNYLHQRIADVTVSLLSFPSGVRAHVFVSWLHPFKEQKLVIVGDQKMAVFDDIASWPEKLTLYPHHIEWHGNIPVPAKAEGQNVEVAEDEPLRAECSHFLECIDTRNTPRTDGHEGLRVLKVLKCCQKALESSSAVFLDESDTAGAHAFFIHDTAVIDDGTEIGKGTKIWHFSHVLKGSKVGERCNIGQNVVIGPNVKVGNGCKIQNNVSVYEGVTLEDEVFCGPSMVFTNVINPRAHIVRRGEYRPTLVGKGATIGANATIICGHTIGKYSFIGAGAVVTKDVPDFALAAGNPARLIGWACKCGLTLPLNPSEEGEVACPGCGLTFTGNSQELRETLK